MTSRLPGSISLPLKVTTDAVYTLKNGATDMLIDGEVIQVTEEERLQRVRARGKITDQPFQVLHDLVHDSLAPLTTTPLDFSTPASTFLSSFTHNALWNTTTTSYGRIDHAEFSAPTFFLRHRFPHITFEWHVKSAMASNLTALAPGEHCELTTTWTAWAAGQSAGGSPVPDHPLVARGRVNDQITIVEGAYPVIIRREFVVDHMIHDELMRATALKLSASASLPNNLLTRFMANIYARFWAVLIFIASFSSPKRSSTILGISAFLASAQGFIDDDEHPLLTLVLASIASIAALLAITAISIDSALGLGKMAVAQAAVLGSTDAFVEGDIWNELSDGCPKANGKQGDKRGNFQSIDSGLLV